MKVIYLFKFNNSEQILSVDVPDNATIDEINTIIFQNNNEWIAREYKSEWEILPHGENPHSAESLAFAQLLAKIACKIDKIESGMRDGLKELNNMLAEANCLSEYPSIPTEYKEDLQSLVSFPAILKSALVQCRHKQSDYPTPAQLLQFFEQLRGIKPTKHINENLDLTEAKKKTDEVFNIVKETMNLIISIKKII